MKRDEFVTIMKLYSPQEANMYKSILETNGIHVYLTGDIATEIMPFGGDIFIELQVPSEDESRAREVLSSKFDTQEFDEGINNEADE
ncbi:MAG: DUF2007 domain-containing protein [Rikenellaceae bacterium]|nr:DUF2007 domain-containing protein [Rikenellaceae bacterium]